MPSMLIIFAYDVDYIANIVVYCVFENLNISVNILMVWIYACKVFLRCQRCDRSHSRPISIYFTSTLSSIIFFRFWHCIALRALLLSITLTYSITTSLLDLYTHPRFTTTRGTCAFRLTVTSLRNNLYTSSHHKLPFIRFLQK